VTIVGLFILVLLWAVALVPPWLRNRSEGHPSDSILSFRQQLSVLERTTPGSHRSVTPIAAYRPMPGSSFTPESPAAVQRRLARQRRRVVLVSLLGVAVFTLLLAVAFGGAAIVVHLLVDVALVTYVVLLVRIQQRSMEREAKVRYLHAAQAQGMEPALLLRRSAN
jgi:hypothetical protein